jgi:DNA repair protein RadC
VVTASQLLGVQTLDYLIVTHRAYFSFRHERLL